MTERPRRRRSRRMIVVLISVAGILVLAGAIAVNFEGLREEWYLFRLQADDEVARAQAAVGLKSVSSVRALPLLFDEARRADPTPPADRAMAKSVPGVYREALREIVDHRQKEAVPALAEIVTRESSEWRRYALLLLDLAGDEIEEALPALVATLRSEVDESVVDVAVGLLDRLPSVSAGIASALLEVFRRRLPQKALSETQLLYGAKQESIDVFSGPQNEVIERKLLSVARTHPQAVIAGLAGWEWHEATGILDVMIEAGATTVLTAGLSSGEPEVRRYIAFALGELEDWDSDIIRGLEAAREDRDPRVRELASRALEKLLGTQSNQR